MTFSTAAYHDDVVRRAQADAADTVTCPHCPALVARKRLNDHISAHHADIVLTPSQRQALSMYEADIEQGLAALVVMAQALANIRNGKLYRETYATFEDYCKGRWGKSRAWGNNHARAATIIAFLSPFVDSDELPVREAQTRALSSEDIPEGFVADAWKLALNTTPNRDPNEVTAAHIKRVGKVINEAITTGGYIDPGTGESEPVSPVAFHAAVLVDQVESLSRQWEHMTRKRQRLFSGEAYFANIDTLAHIQTIELTFPLTVDLSELNAAIKSGKSIVVTLSTDKDAS